MEKLPSAHEINPAFEPIDPNLQQVDFFFCEGEHS